MSNRVISKEYESAKEILKFTDYVAMPVTIDASAVDEVAGKKIMKAGTPLGASSGSILLDGAKAINKLTTAIAGSVTTGSAGVDEIKWTAVTPGVDGGKVKITFVEGSATEITTVAVTTSGEHEIITVTLAKPSDDVTASVADVIAAVKNHEPVSEENAAGGLVVGVPGDGVTPTTTIATLANAAELTGGADATVAGSEGILLKDVDVTDGDREGAMVIYGYIDVSKIDETIPIPGDEGLAKQLPKITFLK